jgi:hypothetical protein
MKVVEPGHAYDLDHLDGSGTTRIQFVSRPPLHASVEGVTNQEVIRALIDRVKVLDAEVPWSGNAQILHHLRMALALHEARAMLRHVEKGQLEPEFVELDAHGHFALRRADAH